MEFQRIDFTEPLIDFLQKFPLLPPNSKIGPMSFSTNMVYDGNALAYTGTGQPQLSRDVLGNVLATKQANFIFYIRRPTNDDMYKLEIADFLYNFESWVEFEDLFGNPPRFGDPDFDERIWADNGMYWQETTTPDVTDYMIQLHISYQLKYESEEY